MKKKSISGKKGLFLSLLFAAVLLASLFAAGIKAEAASKPSPNAKKLTLSTTAAPYTITFKGLADNATITYSSSKRTVASVSKKGVITPKKAGKTTVTCKITQNRKKYTCQIAVTVKNYNTGFLKKIKNMVTDKSNYRLNVQEGVLTTKKQVDDMINSMSQVYQTYTIGVKSLDLLKPEQYYLDKNPVIVEFKYTEIVKYKNCYGVYISSHKNQNLSIFDPSGYNVSEPNIARSLYTGKTDNLSKNELKIYTDILSLAESMKGKTDYDTVKAIHDHLVLTIAYDTSLSKFSVYEALYKGSCVCSGYAKSFYMLCLASGIDAVVVSGRGRNESHAWNKVRINNQWFNVDVTWDDPLPDTPGKVRYEYFMITDEDMSRDHVWDNTGLGVADSKKYGVLYKEIAQYKSFDSNSEYTDWLKSTLKKKAEEITSAKSGVYENTVFIYGSNLKTSYNDTLNTLISVHSDKGVGYSAQAEELGSYGVKIYFKIYR